MVSISEKPQIKDLKVTTENGDITIYCIFEVLIKSPKAHYIAWSKNDQTQNTKNKQCIGGSIHGSCFPITLPSERDIGKYTCTVTNAIGSVSRDVKLGNDQFIIIDYLQKLLCFYFENGQF